MHQNATTDVSCLTLLSSRKSNRAASWAASELQVIADASAAAVHPCEQRRPVFLTPRSSGRYSQNFMMHSTTILAVRHRDRAVLAGDGQVTFGQTVVKQGARKIRRLYNDRILAGFAGSAADSFALFARFESKLEQYRGNLERAAVELAKDWRSDRILRRLEAMLV